MHAGMGCMTSLCACDVRWGSRWVALLLIRVENGMGAGAVFGALPGNCLAVTNPDRSLAMSLQCYGSGGVQRLLSAACYSHGSCMMSVFAPGSLCVLRVDAGIQLIGRRGVTMHA